MRGNIWYPIIGGDIFCQVEFMGKDVLRNIGDESAALFIFYRSGHFSAAASADAGQCQHPRLCLPVEITDACHIYAL
jgi:hypothetical protein